MSNLVIIIMNNTVLILLALAAIFAVQTNATQVIECSSGQIISSVTLTNCDQPPCVLKKGNKAGITQKFTPDHDVNSLTTKVSATLFWGIRAPFVGVDGTSACDKLYHADDNSPAECPLKKGVEYIYKNEFPVESYYPSMSTNVHWALQENGNDVTCFEVDAEISS